MNDGMPEEPQTSCFPIDDQTNMHWVAKVDYEKLRGRYVALEAKMRGKVLVPEESTDEIRRAIQSIVEPYCKLNPAWAANGWLELGRIWTRALAAAKRGEAE